MESTNQAEKEFQELNQKIVKFTNIDFESFTHSYGGISMTARPGMSIIGTWHLCDHLATHLARKILAREKKKTIKPNEKNTLYTAEQVNVFKKKLITEINAGENQDNVNTERVMADIKPKEVSIPAPVKVTRQDIIRDLKARGLKFDIHKTNAELLQMIVDSEAIKS